ncbi:MAG: hypothetical protein E6Q98_05500 [Rhodospirillaceae bacterium]|nr:MAG: hypothetical protein E6Q98_05500 [Rhodospirillaceae bacterium]
MTHKLKLSALLALSLLVTACASDKPATQSAGVDKAAIVSSTDWTSSQSVEVDLADFSFSPETLNFQHNKPYRLHLMNTSSHAHTFSSKTFFKAIAIEKMQKNGTDVSTADLNQDIELRGGEQADLYFVAPTPGNYDLYCDEFLHETMGMSGKIAVL